MIWPHEPSGNSSLANFLRRLLRCSKACELLPGVGYHLTRTTNGTVLSIKASGGRTTRAAEYKLKTVLGDYITAVTWDGTTEGSETIYIAKPYRLRESATETSATFSYSGSGTTRERTKTVGGTTESQRVSPPWDVDEIVSAIAATTSVSNGSKNLDLIMVDCNKAWAKYA